MAKVSYAAKKRQLRGPLHSYPYIGDDAWETLVGLIRETRPWSGERDVAARLHAWAGGDVELLGCVDVAREIARIGRSNNLDSVVASLARDMLWNVVFGRPPWELASLMDTRSVALRTRRRHRAEGKTYHYQRIARERDLRELMEGGRTEAAARRWLQRHPDKDYRDAPPPQLRRSERTSST